MSAGGTPWASQAPWWCRRRRPAPSPLFGAAERRGLPKRQPRFLTTPFLHQTLNPPTPTPHPKPFKNSVFKKEALIALLDEAKTPTKFLDFGGEIIPYAAANGLSVQAYGFDDYWEDIGTIKSFFEENLKLASTVR